MDISRNSKKTDDVVTFGLSILLVVGLGFSFAVLMAGLNTPILDNHHFRQTQTALSTYWLAKGGPWFAYETPVLGAPWAIPFEFPVYQLIVAAVSKLHVPLDAAGRIVNYAFFVLTLVPLGMLARTLGVSRAAYLSVAVLFVFSPLYVYWSRTFLIENCALFFGMVWLALLATYLKHPRWSVLPWAVLAGSLAVLAKSTTFSAFLLVGGLATAWIMVRLFRAGPSWRAIALVAGGAGIAAAVPLVLGFGWVAYSDAVKSANEFGTLLTSEALSGWNFGSLDQKFSASLWKEIVFGRVMPDALGSLYWLSLAAIVIAARWTRSFALVVLAIVAFATPFAVFTNLHIVHTYYQVANAIFLLLAVGLCIGLFFDRGLPLLASALLLLLVGGQVWYFFENYKSVVEADQTHHLLYKASLIARENTSPDQSIIVFGDDWSSSVPYYAERKGIAVPGWIRQDVFERLVADPQSFLGKSPLGAIVACSFSQDESPLQQEFLAGRRVIGQIDRCRILAPERDPTPP